MSFPKITKSNTDKFIFKATGKLLLTNKQYSSALLLQTISLTLIFTNEKLKMS